MATYVGLTPKKEETKLGTKKEEKETKEVKLDKKTK